MLFEDAMELFCDFEVDANTTDVVEELDEGDLRAQSMPDAAQLDADHTGPNHHHALGHSFQGQRARRGDHFFFVDLEKQLTHSGYVHGGDARFDYFASFFSSPPPYFLAVFPPSI